jgi:hypothetical protein
MPGGGWIGSSSVTVPGGIPAIVVFCPSWPGSMTDTALAPGAVPA